MIKSIHIDLENENTAGRIAMYRVWTADTDGDFYATGIQAIDDQSILKAIQAVSEAVKRMNSASAPNPTPGQFVRDGDATRFDPAPDDEHGPYCTSTKIFWDHPKKGWATKVACGLAPNHQGGHEYSRGGSQL